MSITKEQLHLAGWLSVTSALFTIPHIWMSVYFDAIEGLGAKFSKAVMIFVSLGLLVYVLRSFKKLLNTRFQFHSVDIYISLVIWGNVLLSGLSLLSLGTAGLEFHVRVLSILTFIPFGILDIMLGTRLLQISGNLCGLLKPFSYVLIASGVCFISVILSPVGYITSAMSDGILGIIFFRAAEHPPSSTELYHTPIE